MRTLAEDTDPKAERAWLALLRAASPARKLELVLSANRTGRLLALTGLRERHPTESPARLRRRLARSWRPRLTARCPNMNEGGTELLAAIVRVVRTFEALGVDYLVGGSVASSLFGEPRLTVDADLVARPSASQRAFFATGLEGSTAEAIFTVAPGTRSPLRVLSLLSLR